MQIIKGKVPCAKKVVVYGPEGIGKSTFASRFPEPLFIDTEGSTKEMDVSRTPMPSSWEMLKEQVAYVIEHPDICRTLVIDTIDWAEHQCVEQVCAGHQKKGIEDFGYGNGYVYVKEEFGRFLNQLSDVVEAGIHVLLTAHAQIRKFEQPDEMGAYDRWELKLGKKTTSQTSPLVKEWADMVLFANYKTYSIAVDEKGDKHKAQGGRRMMYTSHHPCWDAKNRYGLPEELAFDYSGIAHIFTALPVAEKRLETKEEPNVSKDHTTVSVETDQQAQVSQTGVTPKNRKDVPKQQETKTEPMTVTVNENIPKELRDLMIANNVGEWDIQNVVAARGYYPSDTPIENYGRDFIQGVLVGAWPKVFHMVEEMKRTMEIPFD